METSKNTTFVMTLGRIKKTLNNGELTEKRHRV